MSEFYQEVSPGIFLVSLVGALNKTQSDAIIAGFEEMARQGIERAVVDLEAVTFIDSQGLAALTAGYKGFGSKAENFRLVGLRDQHRLLFEVTGFDAIFQTFQSLDEALAG